MKAFIKNALAAIGVLHPALGVKISPERKIDILLSYQTPQTRTFVETGTEFGATLTALAPHFESLHSVELDEKKYADAREVFKGNPRVHLYQGDSAKILKEILASLNAPALIWLDAHASGPITLLNSPVRGELEAIFADPRHHIVLIDDARHFNRSAIRFIKLHARKNGYRFELFEGLFRLT